MTKPFDSFDEFPNPIFGKPEPKVAKQIEEPVAETKTRGRKKKVEEPIDIPADVPALEE